MGRQRQSVGLGAAVLRARRAWQFGWRVELDTFRAKHRHLRSVAMFEPLPCGDGPLHAVMLLDEARALEGLWSLYSFRLHAGPCRLTVLSDGTLNAASLDRLHALLPGLNVPDASENDSETLAALSSQGLHRCHAWRKEFLFFRKLVDPFRLAAADAVVLLDSDCLHFRHPAEVLAWAERPEAVRYVTDVNAHSLCVTEEEFIAICGVPPPRSFCAGYACVPPGALDLVRIERYLSHPSFERQLASGRFSHVAEQTLLAMEAARLGAHALPPTYLPCPDVAAVDSVMGHFCGGQPSRNWFYTKGLPAVEAHVRRAAGAQAGT